MDFWGTVVVLFRRWYVTLPAFALAVGASFAVYVSIPTTYVSNAVLVLTIPTSGGTQPHDPERRGDLTNPLLNFDHGLSMAASVVIVALGTPEVSGELGVTPGGDPAYQVTNGNGNLEALTQSPFVFITGESTSPESARRIVGRVMVKARQVLDDRQRSLDTPPATFISMSEAVPPTTPLPQYGRRLRAAVTAAALGCVASLVTAFAAESIAQSSRARKAARVEVGDGAPTW
ncbi:YveK family protein [Sphaerimonospora thailandensis]|uniref:Capsular polysaccharide biosynthesis protein n=1 Tax=Sphaerimonospora thailandensis TaxID=795644 RepID=A0A8J3RAL1_9ACTN|nr:hypothetical protein [Sphaerimonospora thailandensis]GIH69058.1 hypothetical protein Mth01_13110 [Sphaerimonospora thailandensis]